MLTVKSEFHIAFQVNHVVNVLCFSVDRASLSHLSGQSELSPMASSGRAISTIQKPINRARLCGPEHEHTKETGMQIDDMTARLVSVQQA